jgi:RNA polymerase sigma-70 factor (ECF subfamily)
MLSFHLRRNKIQDGQAEERAMAAQAHCAMTNSLPDEELMLQVREGVGEMLAVLFDRYQTPLFNFYCRQIGDRAASEDLVQDVFFRILKYRQSYRPGTPFRAWMYQIARNARLDYARKHPDALPFEPEMSPAVIPIDSLESQQHSALLQQALGMLPEEKREILLLSRFQELKHEEIAAMLGCEVGAVKVRVHRALRELRKTFESLVGTPAHKRMSSVPEHDKGGLQ